MSGCKHEWYFDECIHCGSRRLPLRGKRPVIHPIVAKGDAVDPLAAMTAERDAWSAESADNLRKLVDATARIDAMRDDIITLGAQVNSLMRDRDAALERLRRPVDPVAWQPIDKAPYDTPLTVRVGGMTFGAILRRWASETTDGDPCDQWQALIADEHPPCWTDGACWEINALGYGSREPEEFFAPIALLPPGDSQ